MVSKAECFLLDSGAERTPKTTEGWRGGLESISFTQTGVESPRSTGFSVLRRGGLGPYLTLGFQAWNNLGIQALGYGQAGLKFPTVLYTEGIKVYSGMLYIYPYPGNKKNLGRTFIEPIFQQGKLRLRDVQVETKKQRHVCLAF